MNLQLNLSQTDIQKLIILSQELNTPMESLVSYWVDKCYTETSRIKELPDFPAKLEYNVLGGK